MPFLGRSQFSPASKVGEASRKPCSQDCVAGGGGREGVHAVGLDLCVLYSGLQDDGHNDPIDGHSLTEDDTADQLSVSSAPTKAIFAGRDSHARMRQTAWDPKLIYG